MMVMEEILELELRLTMLHNSATCPIHLILFNKKIKLYPERERGGGGGWEDTQQYSTWLNDATNVIALDPC